MSKQDTFWLPEVGVKVATHKVGPSSVMYGPLATRAAADKAVKREIG